jgi:hypothetical protein
VAAAEVVPDSVPWVPIAGREERGAAILVIASAALMAADRCGDSRRPYGGAGGAVMLRCAVRGSLFSDW